MNWSSISRMEASCLGERRFCGTPLRDENFGLSPLPQLATGPESQRSWAARKQDAIDPKEKLAGSETRSAAVSCHAHRCTVSL
jgi:hypothetical protein